MAKDPKALFEEKVQKAVMAISRISRSNIKLSQEQLMAVEKALAIQMTDAVEDLREKATGRGKPRFLLPT